MSRFSKFWKILLFLGIVCLGVLSALYVPRILGLDPFRAFRGAPAEGPGIQLEDVEFSHYHEGQLVTRANIDRIDISKNRQLLQLFGIKEGELHARGKTFNFTAEEAQYDALLKELRVTSEARVYNEDFDVTSETFKYDQNIEALIVPGLVAGRLGEGQVQAFDLKYDIPKEIFTTGPIKWAGRLASIPIQEVTQTDPRTAWQIEGDNYRRTTEKDVYTQGRATDGEILVKGDLIEWERRTDVVTATGKVYYFSEKANLVCDKAVIYRRERRAVLTGNVRVLVKPENMEKLELGSDGVPPWRPPVPESVAASRPQSAEDRQQKDLEDELRSGKTARKYPAHLRGERVEYWYGRGNRRAVITGNPQAFQEFPREGWRRVWTHTAHYDGEGDMLRLESSNGSRETRFMNSIGDDFTAMSVTMSTKEDDENWEAVRPIGVFMADNDEIPRERKPDPGPQRPAPRAGLTTPPANRPPQPGDTRA
jgi:hypothetical protein